MSLKTKLTSIVKNTVNRFGKTRWLTNKEGEKTTPVTPSEFYSNMMTVAYRNVQIAKDTVKYAIKPIYRGGKKIESYNKFTSANKEFINKFEPLDIRKKNLVTQTALEDYMIRMKDTTYRKREVLKEKRNKLYKENYKTALYKHVPNERADQIWNIVKNIDEEEFARMAMTDEAFNLNEWYPIDTFDDLGRSTMSALANMGYCEEEDI